MPQNNKTIVYGTRNVGSRDKDGELAMYENKPFKDERAEQWSLGGWWDFLPENWFPEVQWSDEEPTKIKLVIEK